MDKHFILVYTTCANSEQAAQIARNLIEQRAAACVQEYPVTSTYRWDGKIERDQEIALAIKSTADRFDTICQLIRLNHSYDTPQIVCVPVTQGSNDYLDWVASETRVEPAAEQDE